jgi:hypothetical protein
MVKMRMNFKAKVKERRMRVMANKVEMRMKGLFEVSEDENEDDYNGQEEMRMRIMAKACEGES